MLVYRCKICGHLMSDLEIKSILISKCPGETRSQSAYFTFIEPCIGNIQEDYEPWEDLNNFKYKEKEND